MEKPLVNNDFQLQKYPGKGGWTYTTIPDIQANRKMPFGWVTVKGSIDGYVLKNYKLMPIGKGKLFLPVKASIRKKIGKGAGDYVKVVLYADQDLVEIPEELLLCLKDEPVAHQLFLRKKDSEQKALIDWIFSAKMVETKTQRIVELIDLLIKEAAKNIDR